MLAIAPVLTACGGGGGGSGGGINEIVTALVAPPIVSPPPRTSLPNGTYTAPFIASFFLGQNVPASVSSNAFLSLNNSTARVSGGVATSLGSTNNDTSVQASSVVWPRVGGSTICVVAFENAPNANYLLDGDASRPLTSMNFGVWVVQNSGGTGPFSGFVGGQGCSTLRRLRVASPWGNRCSENGVGGRAAGFPALRKSDS